MPDYKQWYEELGVDIEEQITKWLDNIPEALDSEDTIGNTRDFIDSTLHDSYETYTTDYTDCPYESTKEQQLLEATGF